ncbi:DHH family phosphoesterase [Candidatus Peregrinibacteria bacterium]|nr:DHH family phosphoesterase [Candidatus Peregrinibacteria bacterium]
MTLSQPDISAAAKAIEEHHRILITPHANVDPDGLSSALALYHMLRALGKDATVICPDTLPESLNFLPGFAALEEGVKESENFVVTINLEDGIEVDKLRYTVEDNKVNIIVVPRKGRIKPSQVQLGAGERPYDLIIVIDTADLTLLGSLYTDHIDLFSEVPILNIDHHISNTRFGQIQLIDPTAASATEVLYQWFMQIPFYKEQITPDLATLLLTGLITDTRSFQNPNTTPRSLEVAADLLDRGARQQEIIQHIYKTKPLSTLRIWGRALNHLQIDAEAGVVWSAISEEDLTEMGADPKETSGILDELISTIPGAHIYILFTEVAEKNLKASARSSAEVDISQLAGKLFGGGGHARAAGFKRSGYSNFQLEVLECVQRIKEALKKEEVSENLEIPITNHQSPNKSQIPNPKPAQPTKPSGPIDIIKELGSS